MLLKDVPLANIGPCLETYKLDGHAGIESIRTYPFPTMTRGRFADFSKEIARLISAGGAIL